MASTIGVEMSRMSSSSWSDRHISVLLSSASSTLSSFRVKKVKRKSIFGVFMRELHLVAFGVTATVTSKTTKLLQHQISISLWEVLKVRQSNSGGVQWYLKETLNYSELDAVHSTRDLWKIVRGKFFGQRSEFSYFFGARYLQNIIEIPSSINICERCCRER